MGDWIFVDTSDEVIHAIARLSVYAWHSNEYLAEYCGLGSEVDPSLPCMSQRIYMTRLGQADFVNVQEIADRRDFSFYQFRLQDSLAMELRWAGDSFKPVFATSKAFRQYLKQHPGEFEASFAENNILCYRAGYWTWSTSAAKVLRHASAAWRVTMPDNKDAFLSLDGASVLGRFPHESLAVEDLKALFDPYHVDRDDVQITSFDGFMDPSLDAFFLLERKDGSYLKYITFSSSLVDLTNGILYEKTAP